MRRTPKSRKSTKLENSLWHYQKFFRELKQRRIDFMQQKNYRKFNFGIIYSDCLVAAEQQTTNTVTQTQTQTQPQTQTQKLRKKQAQVQVEVAVKEYNFSYTQHANSLRSRTETTTTKAINATTSNSAFTTINRKSRTVSNVAATTRTTTTTPTTRATTHRVTNAKRRYGNTPTKHMPILTYVLRMPLESASGALQLLVNA